MSANLAGINWGLLEIACERYLVTALREDFDSICDGLVLGSGQSHRLRFHVSVGKGLLDS